MLKSELPLRWQSEGSYLMNQRTFALLMTMSDAAGRPLLMPQLQRPARHVVVWLAVSGWIIRQH
jgi:HK97 family phage major capsid protein